MRLSDHAGCVVDLMLVHRYLVYVAKVDNASDTGLQLNLAVGFTGILIWW